MSHTIRAAVLTSAPGKLEVQNLTLADPGPDEVLLDIAYAGLCHSDLHEIDGTFPTTPPIVLGHEAAGVVAAVGEHVDTLRPGDHVVTCLSAFCGRCRYCLAGRITLCERRSSTTGGSVPRLTDADGRAVRPTAGIGAFAEKAVVHHSALALIPDAMPLAQAAILGCAVTTGYGAVVHRAQVRPGSTVVVIGTGGIGMSAIQAARISGAAQVIAIDLNDDKLYAARRFGATATINAAHTDVVADVLRATGGGADYAFEAVGRAHCVEQAVAMLRPGGVATVVGMVPSHPPIQIDGAELFYAEKTLQGSFMGSNRFPADVATFAAMYTAGTLNLDDMITAIIDLDDINDGFTQMAAGAGLRIVARLTDQHP